jgi:hypothetical protein
LMESFGAIVFEYSNEEDIASFKSILSKVEHCSTESLFNHQADGV